MRGGQLVGLMMDYQMHWVADMGLTGTVGVNPEKLLFLGPKDEVPDGAEGYRVERVTTKVRFLAVRPEDRQAGRA